MDSPVDEIKRRIDVADVIGQSVALKRSGRILKGLCPFHNEKTPSFVVFPETGTWRCFGCSQGGDLFTYVMKNEGLEFGEALRSLAQRSGVELTGAGPTQADRERRDLLLQALESASLFYRGALRERAGQHALEYLRRRGVLDTSIDQFALGYAPRQSGALVAHLKSAGIDLEIAEEAGLIGHSEDGELYERMRGRVIFPIRDGDGKTIAFGGRTLDDEVQPKYLNSPQTDVFDKSSCFYGYDLARSTIRTTRSMTVVEGYMDVLMVHQAGYHDVVATLGTALTERHVRMIRRQVDTVILALDADAAGQRAMRRGLDVVRETERGEGGSDWLDAVRSTSTNKLQLKVMVLPAGKDPDDVVRENTAAWGDLSRLAIPALDFVLSRLPSQFDLSTGRGKSEAVYDALPVIRDLADPIERTHYEQRLAEIVGIDRSDLPRGPRSTSRQVPRKQETALPSQGADTQELLLAIAMVSGEYSELQANPSLRPEVRALLALVREQLSAGQSPDEIFESLSESEFASIASFVLQQAKLLSAHDQTELIRERKTAILRMEQGRLYREAYEMKSTLLEGDAADGEPQQDDLLWAKALDTMTRRMHEIESELSDSRKTGTAVWRPRASREAAGA